MKLKKLGDGPRGTCSHHPKAELVEMEAIHPLSKVKYRTLDCPSCLEEMRLHDGRRCKPETCMWCNFGNGKWRTFRK